jgi:butyryl-CoA dehydrogenase
MDFDLTAEQVALVDLAAKIADERFAPQTLEWDRAYTFIPDEDRAFLANQGFFGMTLPADVGGGEAELLDALLVIEQLAKRNQVASFQVFEATTGAARVIDLHGTPEQRQRFLPDIAQGKKTMAVSISEPEAGSAATDMTTRARRDGDGYVLNGVKRWCSGGGHAELYLVYVRLAETPGAKGIGAIVVEAGTEGFTYGPQERMMGFHGIPSADLFFDDVRVPAENLVIDAGGFGKLFSTFSIERLGNATHSVAIGQACLDRASKFVQERSQFGRELVEFQAVQLALADMIVDVEAARLLLYRAAARAGRGAPDPYEASVAKTFANDMAKRVSESAVQLLGGYGYHPDYHVERHHRDAQGWAIAGGTRTMQRLRIASSYLGRRFDLRR